LVFVTPNLVSFAKLISTSSCCYSTYIAACMEAMADCKDACMDINDYLYGYLYGCIYGQQWCYIDINGCLTSCLFGYQ
jgi:hypothetical protein